MELSSSRARIKSATGSCVALLLSSSTWSLPVTVSASEESVCIPMFYVHSGVTKLMGPLEFRRVHDDFWDAHARRTFLGEFFRARVLNSLRHLNWCQSLKDGFLFMYPKSLCILDIKDYSTTEHHEHWLQDKRDARMCTFSQNSHPMKPTRVQTRLTGSEKDISRLWSSDGSLTQLADALYELKNSLSGFEEGQY